MTKFSCLIAIHPDAQTHTGTEYEDRLSCGCNELAADINDSATGYCIKILIVKTHKNIWEFMGSGEALSSPNNPTIP